MTRIISQAAAAALETGYNFKRSNTRVDGDAQEMYLHGNLIAKIDNGALYITLAGWPTLTTCERLNALNGVHITRRAGKAFLNGKEIDSDQWYKVED